MVLIIAIDTSHNKRYSCVVSGFQSDFDKLYKSLDKLLVSCNEKGPFHWRKLRRVTRKAIRHQLSELINNTKLHFIVFEHKLPANTSKKEFYLVRVPNEIAEYLEHWLKGKYGITEIKLDKDYEVKGVKNSTDQLLYNLFVQLGYRLAGIKVAVFKDKEFHMKVKQITGNLMLIRGMVCDRTLSKEIQIADLVLGHYFYDRSKLINKVKFRKLR